jgi:NADH-quinone oxidoreductase subunit F
MILAAYAVQADRSFIFVRWAYKLAAERLARAISEAYEHGYLGKNILGSGYSLEMHLHTSAGRYICGEATALLNALEGERGVPRHKPPHAAQAGMWSRPTVVNNTETLSNVCHIIDKGAEWFKGLSRTGTDGTRLYQVSGKVVRPGVWELPTGTPAREIIEEHAGGMREGLSLRALLPGGGSTPFLLSKDLDVQMDADSLEKVDSRLGTGTIIVLDDQTCPVGMMANLMHFYARESCGWCTPCRDGLPWTAKVLDAIEEGRGQPIDIERLGIHTRLIKDDATFCTLATGAMQPLRSALNYFRSDLEQHIEEKGCPWR